MQPTHTYDELPPRAAVVICGAGIAGIATAYMLVVRHGLQNVLLLEQRAPMALTSPNPIEGYRNWWPDAMLVGLMNRSIDMLHELAEASGQRFGLSQRGYLYITADAQRTTELMAHAAACAAQGAGGVRSHTHSANSYLPALPTGVAHRLTGADVSFDPQLIQALFPFLPSGTAGIVHARRCGWFRASRLSAYLLAEARAHGLRCVQAEVTGVQVAHERVQAVELRHAGAAHTLPTETFVNAAGPFVGAVARLLGADLPVVSEPHFKLSFRDPHGVVPRDAPLLINTDPVLLPWSPAERTHLAADPATRWLTEPLPAGLHIRPADGTDEVIAAWTYRTAPCAPVLPPHLPPRYAEVVLRGLTSLYPDVAVYGTAPTSLAVDGGYYTRTPENRPLIGALPVPGAYVIGALSGYGLMAACAAGELLAAHITSGPLPAYAAACSPARYADPAYQLRLKHWHVRGEL